ncbi:serum response factor-binding protein 1 isoform X2 [Anabas testudineus]|nr:serum response factor-binding protein 1 isoform X2 [Anabas testudineus]
MMYAEDEMEEGVPLAQDKEEEEVEEEEEEIDDDDDEDEEEEDGSEEEEDDGDDGDVKQKEEMPQASGKTEKTISLPVPPEDKKQTDVLNLNNEVVKMRKEVKRVRALIIRKLTRQIGALKKKKGKDAELERNQRRAARLLEEIHEMKVLLPDLVTKTALQKNLNFEQVCKNPKSSISDRAIARIATHPQFNKKIENIKAAVKAFKEERLKAGKPGGKEKVQNQAGKVNLQSLDRRGGRKGGKDEEESTEEQKEETDNKDGDGILKSAKAATVAKPQRERVKAAHSADVASVQKKDIPESEKSSQEKDVVKDKPQSKDEEKKLNLKPAPAVPQKRKDDEESDLELSDDEEKEYFDDSTEERFHKQSSQSEESDDDNDFFVGKVSKFKKKKKQRSITGEDKTHEVKKDSTDRVQSELDELEARLKSKATSLQSVFCSTLSGSKHSRGRGAGRGREAEKFRGQGNQKGGLNRDFSKQSKFQKHIKPEGSHPKSEEKGFAPVGRGRGRGRGDVLKHRGGGVFSHQAPQQALHPSWEASKKRKEQQGQIMAFQGKKIKFDDDD